MSFPDFFDQVPRITLRDPLADLLGSVTGGLMSYGYADAVRLAGHSCPTVAAAYWLGARAIFLGKLQDCRVIDQLSRWIRRALTTLADQLSFVC